MMRYATSLHSTHFHVTLVDIVYCFAAYHIASHRISSIHVISHSFTSLRFLSRHFMQHLIISPGMTTHQFVSRRFAPQDIARCNAFSPRVKSQRID
jgi:hypothetical protein